MHMCSVSVEKKHFLLEFCNLQFLRSRRLSLEINMQIHMNCQYKLFVKINGFNNYKSGGTIPFRGAPCLKKACVIQERGSLLFSLLHARGSLSLWFASAALLQSYRINIHKHPYS